MRRKIEEEVMARLIAQSIASRLKKRMSLKMSWLWRKQLGDEKARRTRASWIRFIISS